MDNGTYWNQKNEAKKQQRRESNQKEIERLDKSVRNYIWVNRVAVAFCVVVGTTMIIDAFNDSTKES